MNLERYLQYALLALGVLCSFVLVIVFRDFYHHEDLNVFWKWANSWPDHWRNIYISCKWCNYPVIGVFSSAGLLRILGNGDYQNAVFFFRMVLGFVDGVNILLLFWLLKKLDIDNAAMWAGIVGLLPSSWVGGALWGQIDSISQFFILIAFAWIVHNNLREQSDKKNVAIYLAVSGVMLSWIVLSKQTTIFGLFSIGCLLFTSLVFTSKKWTQFALKSLFAAAFFILPIAFWDVFLILKKPYFSHLYYIWKTGSNHGDIISGNGFNIWMFLGRDMLSSSHVPLFFASSANPEVFSFFTPYWIGLFLFLLFNSALAFFLFLFLWKRFSNHKRFMDRDVLLNFLFHFSLVNLSFNIFLTGTHERYLYHFYPFIILAVLGLKKYTKPFSNYTVYILLFGAGLYGSFILYLLSGIGRSHGYTYHWGVGLFHFGLLCLLSITYFRYVTRPAILDV